MVRETPGKRRKGIGPVTDRILIQHGNNWLALSPESYQEALTLGGKLMPDEQQNTPDTLPQWLSAKEMARLTGMSETYWQEEARCRRCPARRFGRSLRFPASYLRSLDFRSTGHDGNGAGNA